MNSRVGAFLFGIASAIVGCAAQQYPDFTGQSINDVILQYGPPDTVLDLDDSRRVYQWEEIDRETRSRVQYEVGVSDGPISISTVFNAGPEIVIREDTCLRTVFARRSGQEWFVDEIHRTEKTCR